MVVAHGEFCDKEVAIRQVSSTGERQGEREREAVEHKPSACKALTTMVEVVAAADSVPLVPAIELHTFRHGGCLTKP